MSQEHGPKLGQLISGAANKDATHVAVAPVELLHPCLPGQHVGVTADGFANKDTKPHVGIIDPFLPEGKEIPAFSTAWIILYPGTVKNLRHEWDHPSFPEPEPEEPEYNDGCYGC